MFYDGAMVMLLLPYPYCTGSVILRILYSSCIDLTYFLIRNIYRITIQYMEKVKTGIGFGLCLCNTT